MKKNDEDIALVHEGVRLDGRKTFAAQQVTMSSEAIVEPLKLMFVYKVEGE